MTVAIAAPRYSADDFETASIRSAAPSYVSEVPSYHSVAPYPEAVPPYSPPASRAVVTTTSRSLVPASSGGSRRQTIGLPPVPTGPVRSVPNLNNFRIATWSSVTSSPTARHYHNVAQRRATAQRDTVDILRRAMTDHIAEEQQRTSQAVSRPLEDPRLVGDMAATRARQARLARERGDDILLREDRQWDWFLARMKDIEERERTPQPRQKVSLSPGKRLLRRIGGRRLL